YFFDCENMMFVVQVGRDDHFSRLFFESGKIIHDIFARRKRNGGQVRGGIFCRNQFYPYGWSLVGSAKKIQIKKVRHRLAARWSVRDSGLRRQPLVRSYTHEGG